METVTVYVTCAEMAALRGGSASAWRKRCAAGKIPGAFKKGKTWLIPVSWWWACAEVYPGSGRPSRTWVQKGVGVRRPDRADENGTEYVPYPFNMNGCVIAGPFDTEREAEQAINNAICVDDDGLVYWR